MAQAQIMTLDGDELPSVVQVVSWAAQNARIWTSITKSRYMMSLRAESCFSTLFEVADSGWLEDKGRPDRLSSNVRTTPSKSHQVV